MMFRRSRELEDALALLTELGPKVADLERENDELRAKLAVYESAPLTELRSSEDELALGSYTFGKLHQQIEVLKAEVESWRAEVEIQNGVVKKTNEELRVVKESHARMLEAQRPIEDERNRLQVQVRTIQDELEALRHEKDEEVTRIRNEGYARITQIQMQNKDEVERLSNDLVKAMRERDIFASKLQQGLASLTAAINEVADVEANDVRTGADE